MRDAKVTDLKIRTLPVLTARLTARELAKWFPVELHPIPNPYELPEPCRAAIVLLECGHPFLMCWFESSRELMLRIPVTADPSAFLSALFSEIGMPKTRILWRLADALLPKRARVRRS
jgi:hypothetical protein